MHAFIFHPVLINGCWLQFAVLFCSLSSSVTIGLNEGKDLKANGVKYGYSNQTMNGERIFFCS